MPGTIFVAPDAINATTELCMETGAILEAHKLNEKITHSICVVRNDEESELKVLSPCGICQERLFYWEPNVKVAVTLPDKKTYIQDTIGSSTIPLDIGL